MTCAAKTNIRKRCASGPALDANNPVTTQIANNLKGIAHPALQAHVIEFDGAELGSIET